MPLLFFTRSLSTPWVIAHAKGCFTSKFAAMLTVSWGQCSFSLWSKVSPARIVHSTLLKAHTHRSLLLHIVFHRCQSSFITLASSYCCPEFTMNHTHKLHFQWFPPPPPPPIFFSQFQHRRSGWDCQQQSCLTEHRALSIPSESSCRIWVQHQLWTEHHLISTLVPGSNTAWMRVMPPWACCMAETWTPSGC